MLIVCVHYPLDPQMSKTCIARNEHEFEHVSELTIPFTASPRTFFKAVERMYILGHITGSERFKLKRQFEKDRHEKFMEQTGLATSRWSPEQVRAPRNIPSN